MTTTNLLDIPQLEYNGNDYAVVFELINLNRIDIRLVSGLPL